MEARHRYELERKLDKLYHQGWVEFEKWELLSIFNKRRLRNQVFQEIKELWDERFPRGKEEDLAVIEVKSEDSARSPHSFIIVNNKNLQSLSDFLE